MSNQFTMIKQHLDDPYSELVIEAGKRTPGGDHMTRAVAVVVTSMLLNKQLEANQAILIASLIGNAWQYLNKVPGSAEGLAEVIAAEQMAEAAALTSQGIAE